MEFRELLVVITVVFLTLNVFLAWSWIYGLIVGSTIDTIKEGKRIPLEKITLALLVIGVTGGIALGLKDEFLPWNGIQISDEYAFLGSIALVSFTALIINIVQNFRRNKQNSDSDEVSYT